MSIKYSTYYKFHFIRFSCPYDKLHVSQCMIESSKDMSHTKAYFNIK